MILAALFDLDGVIRQYDAAHPARVCRAHGLADDAVSVIAFEAATLAAATADALTFEQWKRQVADELSRRHGVDGTRVAEEFFAVEAATIDQEVVAIVRAVRRLVPVGLLTNATSRLPEELAHFGLTEEFDVVCNSWELGLAKPDPAIYAAAAAAMGVAMSECFFTDDRVENVTAARAAGMTAHHFTGAPLLRAALAGTDPSLAPPDERSGG